MAQRQSGWRGHLTPLGTGVSVSALVAMCEHEKPPVNHPREGEQAILELGGSHYL